jgi:hypothetical protein
MSESINTIYCECVNPVWDYYIEAGNLKYKPVAWIGSDRQEAIYKKYDFAFFNREDTINQQISVPKISGTEETYDDLLQNEILIRMYGRFSLQRVTDQSLITRLNRWNFEFWEQLFAKYSIEALIFPETPHVPYSYAGFLLANKRKIKVLYTTSPPLINLAYFIKFPFYYNYFLSSYYFDTSYEHADQERYREKLINDYGIKKNSLKIKPVSYSSFIYTGVKNVVKNLFIPKKHRFAQIYKDDLRILSTAQYYFELLKRGMQKKKSKDFYMANAISTIPVNRKLKAIFALHYEPEMMVLPLAGKNFDQLKVIRQLSNWLGEEGELYVKEHPWMFDLEKIRGFNRGLDFYKELLKLKNVKMLHLDFDLTGEIVSFDLITTITGTIGWEAFLLKKPVVVFSTPWYYGLPLVYSFDPSVSPINIIEKSNEERDKIDFRLIYEELDKMPKFSLRSYEKTPEEYRSDALLMLNHFNYL